MLKNKGMAIMLITLLLSVSRPILAADTSGGNTGTGQSSHLSIEAQAAIVMDQAGHILYKKNEQIRMYPASTTKILTALLAVENCDLNETVTVGPEISMIPITSGRCGLEQGESITMRDMLYGMLLRSGNDAAAAIAVFIARRANPDITMNEQEALGEFSWMMNQRAQELGAKDSHFVNPHGLHEPEHYSTARDLALIAITAMQDPFLKEVVATPSYSPAGRTDKATGQALVWINTNKLLDKQSPFYMAYATGIKTGHTEEAGYCLVSSARSSHGQVYAIVLNSTQNGVWKDSAQLLDYGLAHSQPINEEQESPAKKAKLPTPTLPKWTYLLMFASGVALLVFVGMGFSRLASKNSSQP
ncbi:MAG: D-alanyl-D-alanine carboxypeptidase family protein [Deltaproteobacteria bacterium]